MDCVAPLLDAVALCFLLTCSSSDDVIAFLRYVNMIDALRAMMNEKQGNTKAGKF